MKHPRYSRAVSTFSILEDKYFCRLFVLSALLVVVALGIDIRMAQTASATAKVGQMPLTGYCSNPSPHCYAEREWNGHTGGAYTRIQPFGVMDCQGCTGFVSNEMWFSDTSSSQCVSVGYCWVEAGVYTRALGAPGTCNSARASVCLFWADNRPGTGGFHEHGVFDFGAIGVNLSSYLLDIQINNADSNSSSGRMWAVTLLVYLNGSLIATPGGTSQYNSMNVNDITVGSEVSDTKAYSDIFELDYNQWLNGNGAFQFQTTPGKDTSTYAPPTGFWATTPCSCSGNTGGSFATYDH